MRCSLRLLAVLVFTASVAWWIAAGARVGWWQTRVAVERVDEITGLTVVDWQERFVPGIETPSVGLLVVAATFGLTFFLRRKLPPDPHSK